MQPEYLEEDLERLSDAPERVLSCDSFLLPIERLFSKRALTVDVDDTVEKAIAKMREAEYGAVVVTRDGKVAGLLTERELICNVIGVLEQYEQRKVHTVMLSDPVTLTLIPDGDHRLSREQDLRLLETAVRSSMD